MKYFIKHKGINEDETQIECELRVGDYCSIETDSGDVELKVVKRTYYTLVQQWIFWGELANEQ